MKLIAGSVAVLCALACACGPGASPGSVEHAKVDGRTDRPAAGGDSRASSGSGASGTPDRSRGHVGNGKR